ncbi:MAG: primosomal protein [Caulobacteraceae bacterium]
MPDLSQDADDQEMAETFDETNITRDGEDIAHPDMARDVYDVTRALGDDDDEEAENDDDFDPDTADDADLDLLLGADDGIDEPDAPTRDDADLVTTDDDNPADFEGVDEDGEIGELSPAPEPPTEKEIDRGLKETFPASDPISINPGAD